MCFHSFDIKARKYFSDCPCVNVFDRISRIHRTDVVIIDRQYVTKPICFLQFFKHIYRLYNTCMLVLFHGIKGKHQISVKRFNPLADVSCHDKKYSVTALHITAAATK